MDQSRSNLHAAFDAFLSDDNGVRSEAENFFTNLIRENPDFYAILFDFYNTSSNIIHKKLCLIFAKHIIKMNFNAFFQNLAPFSQSLSTIILNTSDKNMFKLQAELIFQIAFNINEIWGDFPQYLLLYRENANYLPFCFYLYIYSNYKGQLSHKYNELFIEIDQEITLLGLHCEDPEIQIMSTGFITRKVSKSNDDSIFEQYHNHFEVIYEIARNSTNMDYQFFNLFWEQFFCLKIRHLNTISLIAKEIFVHREQLSLLPSSQLKILQIIVSNYPLITPQDLECIINSYFFLQKSVEEIDQGSRFFESLAKIDFNQTYELFKSNISFFLEFEDEFILNTGLVMLNGSLKTFKNHINGDISYIIDRLLEISLISIDLFDLATKYIVNFLKYNKFNARDTEKIYLFILRCFVDQTNIEYQLRAYKICQKMGPNPVYFDGFLEKFESIQEESLPLFFSLLVNLHSIENDMTNDKYESFFQFIIQCFSVSSQKVDELNKQFIQSPKDEFLLSQYNNCTLCRNSCSNLIYLFSIFNPIRFGELFEQSIQCFIDFLSKDELRENEENYFSYSEIIKDFTHILLIEKTRSIEILKNFYSQIFQSNGFEYLQQALIEIDNIDYKITYFAEEFNDFFNDLFNPKNEIEFNINKKTKFILLPMSKWLHKLDDKTQTIYYKVVFQLFKSTKSSPQLFINLTKILKRLVKYRVSNANLFMSMNVFLKKIVEIYLPQFDQSIYNQLFEAFVNIMKFFIYSKNEYGNEFLLKIILPFYEKFTESSEIRLLNLFSKMIDMNFFNENEFELIIQIIDSIIKRDVCFYLDSTPYLFKVLTKICKIKNEFFSKYFQFALKVFNDVKDQPILLSTKTECSFFLLSLFNKNSTDSHEFVIPLIPEILSVFPCKNLMNQFFIEIKTFIEIIKDSFNDNITKVLLAALCRYLSYQNNAPSIFKFDLELNIQLHEMFKQLLSFYCQNFGVENVEKLIGEIIQDHSLSVQYILSLIK